MSFVIRSNISQINNHVIIKDINHHSVTFPISDAIPQKTVLHQQNRICFYPCYFERSVPVTSSNGLFVILLWCVRISISAFFHPL